MSKNQALQLLSSIGLDLEHATKQAHGDKNPKATKSGPGRFHKPSDGEPNKRTRACDALMEAWAQKRVINWKGERDEHGAFTRVGCAGKKWLAGISAQRGY